MRPRPWGRRKAKGAGWTEQNPLLYLAFSFFHVARLSSRPMAILSDHRSAKTVRNNLISPCRSVDYWLLHMLLVLSKVRAGLTTSHLHPFASFWTSLLLSWVVISDPNYNNSSRYLCASSWNVYVNRDLKNSLPLKRWPFRQAVGDFSFRATNSPLSLKKPFVVRHCSI